MPDILAIYEYYDDLRNEQYQRELDDLEAFWANNDDTAGRDEYDYINAILSGGTIAGERVA